MLCPRLPFLPRRRLQSPAEALRLGPLPRPRVPAAGAARGSAEAPGSPSASPFLAVEQRRADSPAQPPPAPGRAAELSPGRCPSPRPRIILSGSPAALARGRGPTGAAGTHPAPGRRRPPQDERSLGRRGKPRRVGVCGRARTRCPGARCLQPWAGPRPQRRGPCGRRPWPQEPAPTRRRLLRQRRRVSPALRAASPSPPPPQLWLLHESGDGGRQTRASSPPSASRPPPSYSHMPPPGATSSQARGAAPDHPRQTRDKKEAGGRHPPSQAPSTNTPAAPPAAGPAPSTHCVRAHRTHLPADCGMRRPRGRWRSWRVGF